MFTVALIGADGAGKTTIGRRIERTLPRPVKYIYMGVNLESSNYVLPTSRLFHRIKRGRGARSSTDPFIGPSPHWVQPGPPGRILQFGCHLRSGLRLANHLAEEWFRQGLAWFYQRRGYIVLFDRHFYSDYYAYDIARNPGGRSLYRRIHGFVLQRVYPQPDLVIFLDAPAQVLLKRKGEGTLESLERRRQEYWQLRDKVKHFVRVDAARSEDEVACAVREVIWEFYRFQTNGTLKIQDARR